MKETANREKRNKVSFGRHGEVIASQFLEEQGWEIVERNWRNGKKAEIDLIARDPDDVLVFLEVKTRRTEEESSERVGFEAVHGLKRHRIVNSAAAYLLETNLRDPMCRFDVVVLQYRGVYAQEPELTHVRNAFHGLGWS